MSVAFKVASSSGRVKVGTYPYSKGAVFAIPPSHVTIYGFWPRYQTSYWKWGTPYDEVKSHWGRRQLNTYLVTKRLEERIEVYDQRIWWK